MREMIRKVLMVALAILVAWAFAAPAGEPWDALRQGGVVILMRHSITEPGTGDPPGFRPGDCQTQRNLSRIGRVQAQRMGTLLASHGVQPVGVLSSAWCRCVDTARLAFPSVPVRHFSALDSLFMDTGRGPAQTAALREAVGRIAPSGVTVWVTHQVNVTALTGEYLGMGDALVLRPDGAGSFQMLGRLIPPEH